MRRKSHTGLLQKHPHKQHLQQHSEILRRPVMLAAYTRTCDTSLSCSPVAKVAAQKLVEKSNHPMNSLQLSFLRFCQHHQTHQLKCLPLCPFAYTCVWMCTLEVRAQLCFFLLLFFFNVSCLTISHHKGIRPAGNYNNPFLPRSDESGRAYWMFYGANDNGRAKDWSSGLELSGIEA